MSKLRGYEREQVQTWQVGEPMLLQRGHAPTESNRIGGINDNDKSSSTLRQLHLDQLARPLMFVRAISIVVVIFWLQAFGVVLLNAFTGNFIGAIYQLPFMFALGFPAWVFWRSLDATSTVTDPLMRTAYVVLGTICLIVVLIAGLALMASYIGDTNDIGVDVNDIGDTNFGMMAGLFSQFLVWEL